VLEDLLHTETLLGVFPREALEKVLEVCGDCDRFENVPEGFSIGCTEALEIRVF
jgi:hypothetical protein